MNRRNLLTAAMVGGVAGAQSSVGFAAEPGGLLPSAKSLEALHEPFVNFERAYALMEANKVDAVVVRIPTNVYYMTGSRPLFGMETFDTGPIAVLSRRPNDKIAVIMAAFSYYYQYADSRPTYPYSFYLHSGVDPIGQVSAAGEPAAMPFEPLRDIGKAPLDAVEASRAMTVAQVVQGRPPSANSDWALRKALKDLGLIRGVVAVDDPQFAARIGALEPGMTVIAGDNLVRRLRQVKTPAAIALTRAAAQANADAAHAAVLSTARPGATYRDLRAAFYGEVAKRGGAPVALLINAVSSPLYDAEFKAGDAFLIDAVSEFQLCHGDYGRTVTIGDAPASLKRGTEAAQLGWRAIRDVLKPGLTFSQIRAVGREALRRDGYDFDVRFGPHNVGLNHNEDPYRPDQPFFVADTPLEIGMVLSVDCPVLNSGMGGSVHLEDLVEITADGHRPLNDLSHPVITV